MLSNFVRKEGRKKERLKGRERERERNKGRKKERKKVRNKGRKRERKCVCVLMLAFVYGCECKKFLVSFGFCFEGIEAY